MRHDYGLGAQPEVDQVRHAADRPCWRMQAGERATGDRALVNCPTCLYWIERERTRPAREARQAAAKRSAELRRPPRLRSERGRCSLCGTTDLPPRRQTWCSEECVSLWNVASLPAYALTVLLNDLGRVCWGCGDRDPEALEVEHVRPLWSLSEVERLELRWWLPFNLQLLCPTCHKGKTRREAGERAALRRALPR